MKTSTLLFLVKFLCGIFVTKKLFQLTTLYFCNYVIVEVFWSTGILNITQ